MKSPFPGMDPYLEDPAYWEGFHHLFIGQAVIQLSQRLPEPYIADATERVRLISVTDEAAPMYVPDVAVSSDRDGDERRSALAAPRSGGTLATLEPVTIPSLETMEIREHSIEIRRLPDRELVTTIELLSPSNKLGEGIGEYRSKRSDLLTGRVNVVEIDLLRYGTRTKLARPLPSGDYFTFVFFGERRRPVEVYAWSIRRALPTFPIPLRAPDPPVPFDLAAVVSDTYNLANYGRKIKYSRPIPPPALSADDAKWAAELMAAARA
jgi:hypothetical protein